MGDLHVTPDRPGYWWLRADGCDYWDVRRVWSGLNGSQAESLVWDRAFHAFMPRVVPVSEIAGEWGGFIPAPGPVVFVDYRSV